VPRGSSQRKGDFAPWTPFHLHLQFEQCTNQSLDSPYETVVGSVYRERRVEMPSSRTGVSHEGLGNGSLACVLQPLSKWLGPTYRWMPSLE